MTCEAREECNKNNGDETIFGVETCEPWEECCYKGANITRVGRIEG